MVVLLASSCTPGSDNPPSSSGQKGASTPTTAPPQRSSIAGAVAHGPFIGIDELAAAAWDGTRVWLTDSEGRLLAVDGQSGDVALDRRLDSPVSDTAGLTVAPGNEELWGFTTRGKAVEVLRIHARSGEATSKEVDRGRPLGQSVLRDNSLVVADYHRRIVVVDPGQGTTRTLVELNVIPNFVQPAPAQSFWVVDDPRHRLLRVDSAGKTLVDSQRERTVSALAVDGAGNAWLAEHSAVVAIAPSGEIIRELSGFANATTVYFCGGSVVISDIETGELTWFDFAKDPRRLSTGVPGRAVACTTDGVWFLSNDGYLARLGEPRQ